MTLWSCLPPYLRGTVTIHRGCPVVVQCLRRCKRRISSPPRCPWLRGTSGLLSFVAAEERAAVACSSWDLSGKFHTFLTPWYILFTLQLGTNLSTKQALVRKCWLLDPGHQDFSVSLPLEVLGVQPPCPPRGSWSVSIAFTGLRRLGLSPRRGLDSHPGCCGCPEKLSFLTIPINNLWEEDW